MTDPTNPPDDDSDANQTAEAQARAKPEPLQSAVAALAEKTAQDDAERQEREAAAVAVSREPQATGTVNPLPRTARITFPDLSTSRDGEPLPTVMRGVVNAWINGKAHYGTFEASGVLEPGEYTLEIALNPN